MRVRMVTTAAGPMWTFLAGQEYDVEPDLAVRLLQAGAAVALRVGAEVTAAPEPERAVASPSTKRRKQA